MNWIRILDIGWHFRTRGIIPSLLDVYSIIFKPLVAKTLPRDLQVEITTKCNLLCPFCPRTIALGKNSNSEPSARWEQEISLTQFIEILNQVKGVQTLSLHGLGEPMMNPHLLEMIEIASSRSIKVRFTTNATLLTNEKSIRLVSSNLRRLIISFDGGEKESFEKLRKNANFDRVVLNIKRLVQYRNEIAGSKLVICVNSVISKENKGEVKQMIHLMAHIGIDMIILSAMSSPESSMKEFTLEDWEWKEVCQLAKKTAGYLGIKLFISGRKSWTNDPSSVYSCTKPWLASMVKLNGGVTPCCYINNPKHELGNIRETPFENIWKGTKYRAFRKTIRRNGMVPESCKQCPLFA